GSKMAAVARQFCVDYQRLKRRIQGTNSRSTRPAGNRKLTDSQEEALIAYIERQDSIGVHARVKFISAIANEILARSHLNPSIPPPTVGQHWPARFLKRHPELFVTKQKPIEPERKDAHDIEVIKWWFKELKAILEKYNIQCEDCWNMDETGT